MLSSVYELIDEELDSLAVFFQRLNREIIPSTTAMFGNRPRYDFAEYPQCYLLTMDLAGIDRKDLHITLRNHETILAVTGKKTEKNRELRREYLRKERKYGNFTRFIDLPEDADTNRLKARFDDGVLQIEIPKESDAIPDNVKTISIDE